VLRDPREVSREPQEVMRDLGSLAPASLGVSRDLRRVVSEQRKDPPEFRDVAPGSEKSSGARTIVPQIGGSPRPGEVKGARTTRQGASSPTLSIQGDTIIMRTSAPLTEAELHALITEIPVRCPATVFTVSRRTFTASQAKDFLESVLDAETAVAAARAALMEAIQDRDRNRATDGIIARAIRDALALQFSDSPTDLLALAITPRKPRKPMTGEARLLFTAKLRATRKARGTTSKQQKAKIKGTVTGVLITPITSATSDDPPPSVAGETEVTSPAARSP
jgi:hypothetical protein